MQRSESKLNKCNYHGVKQRHYINQGICILCKLYLKLTLVVNGKSKSENMYIVYTLPSLSNLLFHKLFLI